MKVTTFITGQKFSEEQIKMAENIISVICRRSEGVGINGTGEKAAVGEREIILEREREREGEAKFL
jgi:hypothetical protein